MLALAKEFKAFSGDQMVTHPLPTTPYTTNGGADVLKLDTAGGGADLRPVQGHRRRARRSKPADVTLSVRNSSGVNGAAAKAQGQLQTLGFVVSGTDTGHHRRPRHPGALRLGRRRPRQPSWPST